MPGPKTQKVLDKLVVPQHKGEAEVWQNSRWVSHQLVPVTERIMTYIIVE
jgi:ABC-type uncharacterized transport system auxiliary subunit